MDEKEGVPSPRPSPASGRGGQLRVRANKNRLLQVSRTGGRKLFGEERKETFLEWFAATCNVKLSAEKAGVAYQTVFKHRMKDEAFAEGWDRALQQGYARLEARLLAEAGGYSGARPTPAPPCQGGEAYEIAGDFDDPEIEERFDPQLALAILREQKRNVHGRTPKQQRTTARAASNEEIVAALTKRLKAFALRQGSGQAIRVGREEAKRLTPPDGEPDNRS